MVEKSDAQNEFDEQHDADEPLSSTRPSAQKRGRPSRKTGDEKPVQRVRLRVETRAQMLERLTNPQISLHEASVILDVCSATVRHYADDGKLAHTRTTGGQRRFRLREVLALGRVMEARKRKRR